MTGTKLPWQSVTVVSAAASTLVSVMGLFGVTVDPRFAGDAIEAAAQFAAAALSLVAVYGRMRATTRIGR